ncbi:hypothetical protein Hanom_Chr00s000253g01630261 [Helianthus anomalus]
MAWCEKITRILKHRRRVRRPVASAPPTRPESFVTTLPGPGTVTVSLTMEFFFKSSYKEDVKVVKIGWGAILVLHNVVCLEKKLAPLIYMSMGLLWLSIVCWLVVQVYKHAKEDPKEDWLWNGVGTGCYCACVGSFFIAFFLVFFAYENIKIK